MLQDLHTALKVDLTSFNKRQVAAIVHSDTTVPSKLVWELPKEPSDSPAYNMLLQGVQVTVVVIVSSYLNQSFL